MELIPSNHCSAAEDENSSGLHSRLHCTELAGWWTWTDGGGSFSEGIQFMNEFTGEVIDVSVNYDPTTGQFGTIKPASGK